MAGTHLVARQTIEIRVADRGAADGLMAGVRALAPRLAEAVAGTLDRHDGGGVRRRIDRIDLDLGRLPADGWESLLLAGVARGLDEALRAAAERETDGEAGATALAAFATFVRFGRLPWWGRSGETPADVARALAAERPTPADVRRLLRLPGAIARLVRQLDSDSLATLVRLAGGAGEHGTMVAPPAPPTAALPPPVPAADQARWETRLLAAADGKPDRSGPSGPLPGAGESVPQHGPAPPGAALRAQIMALAAPGDAAAEDLALLADRLSAPEAEAIAPALAADPQSGLDRLAAALLSARLAERAAIAPILSRLAAARAARPAASGPRAPAADAAEADPRQTRRADALAEAHDSLPVDTAGLVLLWPFLPPFAERLGLAEDGAFVTIAAQHRAASHFFHLATGEEALGEEARMGLAKLLAGLPIAAVHCPGGPLDDTERAEGEALLAAVLAEATMLGRLGVGGFRAAFLARAGMLAARDDHWLLRVERAGPDVLLDRLPWPRAWVRLPWMPAPLAVEW